MQRVMSGVGLGSATRVAPRGLGRFGAPAPPVEAVTDNEWPADEDASAAAGQTAGGAGGGAASPAPALSLDSFVGGARR